MRTSAAAKSRVSDEACAHLSYVDGLKYSGLKLSDNPCLANRDRLLVQLQALQNTVQRLRRDLAQAVQRD